MSSVDVIVPCYRYGHFLRQCVESVLGQSGPSVRVLIIDDASPDNTAEVAADLSKDDARVTFWRHPENRGHIATYNEGIAWASGDYLLLLSADDYLLPGALSRAADLMDAHQEVGLTFGKAIELSDSAEETETLANAAVELAVNGATSSVLGGEEFFALIESFRSLNIVRTPTAVVRTEVQERLGGYRSELPHSGDLEMWLRLAAHRPVGVLSAFQAVYRSHGDNMQRAYYRKFLPDLEQRKAAIDFVLDTHSAVLCNVDQHHRKLMTPLADQALGYAVGAFNDGDVELARQLSAFAVGVNPAIRKTTTWVMLGCKQRIGPRLWRVIAPKWARWLFAEAHMVVAHFSGGGVVNNNPRATYLRKKVNEYISIAYFADRRLLAWRNVARVGFRAITPRYGVKPRERFYHLWLFCRLITCRISKPAATSRYF